MDLILEGKVVMMTGAGRGLGLSMATGLAAAGAKVAMIDVDGDVLAGAAREVEAAGGQGAALPVVADVSRSNAARTALERTLDRYGRLDVLVNDAAIGPQQVDPDYMSGRVKFWELDDRLWQRMLEVNLFGPQLMARTVVPHLLESGRGRIVNVTTSLDTMYRPGLGAYGPTKAGLEAHTRIMAQDLEGTGVTANVLVPGGPANTRMFADATGFAKEDLIQPDAMQAPVVWLASDDSDGINGMRFIAVRWDPDLPRDDRIARAGAPAAWPQLGAQAHNPGAADR